MKKGIYARIKTTIGTVWHWHYDGFDLEKLVEVFEGMTGLDVDEIFWIQEYSQPTCERCGGEGRTVCCTGASRNIECGCGGQPDACAACGGDGFLTVYGQPILPEVNHGT